MFYEVKSKALIEQIEAWMQKRHEAENAFLRLSRRVGASRNRYASSNGFANRTFAFVFNKEPDRKHWKQTRNGHWLPKLSSKEGKACSEEVRAIELADGYRSDLSQLFGVDDFWKNVGIQQVGERWVIAIEEGWKFSLLGLKRISDVQLEKLQAEDK